MSASSFRHPTVTGPGASPQRPRLWSISSFGMWKWLHRRRALLRYAMIRRPSRVAVGLHRPPPMVAFRDMITLAGTAAILTAIACALH